MSSTSSSTSSSNISDLPYLQRLWKETQIAVVEEPVQYALYDLALKLFPVTVSCVPVVGFYASAAFLGYSFFIDAAIISRFDPFCDKIKSFFDREISPAVQAAGVTAQKKLKEVVVKALLSP